MTTLPDIFSPSPELAALIADVRTLASKHTRFDWSALALNVPLMLLTYGIVKLSTEDASALKTTPMPDKWVVRAAALTGASLKNLKRLSSVMQAEGLVSIEDADRFCCVELERERQTCVESKREVSVSKSQGASALAARIEAAGIEPSIQEALTQGRK